MKRNALLLFYFLLPLFSFGINVTVSNVALTGQNTALNTYQVNFDISWENSWRTSSFESNWDAVWVVVKFKEDTQDFWQHASVTFAESVFPAGSTADFGGSTGFFLYRDTDGIGDVNFQNISVRWSYGGSFPDDQVLEVCVLATEMVYIPEGAFEVGDDSPNPEANFQAGVSTNPYTISSENLIQLGGTTTSNLNVTDALVLDPDDFSSAQVQTLPAAFPKGFQAFYIMKYEATEQQYADFLNKVSVTGAANRFPNQEGSSGHALSNTGVPPEVYVSAAPNQACAWLTWADQAAYADWIGLRPISELEYEKAARGTRDAVPDEAAWGSSFAANFDYFLANQNQFNERVTNPGTNTGNALYISTSGNITGPVRNGIFAASALTKDRRETGGSYYGVMELSGNIWELTITVGDPEGRQFNGDFAGNGIVSTATASSTVSTWPPISGASFGEGTGVRGGGFNNTLQDLSVSNRSLGSFPIDSRFSDVGMRLGRTAP